MRLRTNIALCVAFGALAIGNVVQLAHTRDRDRTEKLREEACEVEIRGFTQCVGAYGLHGWSCRYLDLPTCRSATGTIPPPDPWE